MEAKDRIIVALDVDSLNKTKSLVKSLSPHVGCFKIGLELITVVGAPRAVDFVHSLGGQVFYDGKFCDIPNTVGKAAKAAADLKVKTFNVHASAGIEAMRTAVANKGQSLVLAVTLLTSLNARDIFSLGYPSCWPCVESFEHYEQYDLDKHAYLWPLVKQMAWCAKLAGCDGIVCSPQELQYLKDEPLLKDMLKIVPGVRPLWAAANDQKRIMTPAEAIKNDASALVIGRPITNPPPEIGTPVDAVQRIAEEILAVL